MDEVVEDGPPILDPVDAQVGLGDIASAVLGLRADVAALRRDLEDLRRQSLPSAPTDAVIQGEGRGARVRRIAEQAARAASTAVE